MTTLLLALVTLLVPGLLAQAQAPPPAAGPDRPGVFAITDRGVVELAVFGERRLDASSRDGSSRWAMPDDPLDRSLDAAPRFGFPSDFLTRVPSAASIARFRVNMLDWTPRDLYLVVGLEGLQSPTDKHRRLNGRAYKLGPMSYEIVTEDLDGRVLADAYRKLAGRKPKPGASQPFVVVELRHGGGLSPRSYPIRVEMGEPQEK